MNDHASPPTNSTGRLLAIIGTVLQLSPIIGLVGTVIGMMKAFQALGASGISDPSTLSKAIGEVLISAAAGMVVGLLGTVLLAVGVLLCHYRQRWAVNLLKVIVILWVIGLLILGAAILFTPKSTSSDTSCLTPTPPRATVACGHSLPSAAACSAC